MVDIFDYADYRKFIFDFQIMKSASNPNFSYRYLAQRAGINSSSFYTQIVKGKRNLTKQTVLKTCIALNLSESEAEYFENLVYFNQANTVKEKNIFFEKLVQKQKLRNVRKIDDDQYEYFSAWYHPVIREAVTIMDFGKSYARLGAFINPPISASEAENSVNLLLSLGFLKWDDNKLVQSEPLLTNDTSSLFKIHKVTTYQIEMLRRTIEAFDRWQADKRLTSATVFSISKKTYAQFVEIIRNARTQMMKLTKDDNEPDSVYLLSVNLIPMTVSQKRGGRHA